MLPSCLAVVHAGKAVVQFKVQSLGFRVLEDQVDVELISKKSGNYHLGFRVVSREWELSGKNKESARETRG